LNVEFAVSIPAALHPNVKPSEHEALSRLLAIAVADTGQSRRVADFLLAWWNPAACGAFDITTAWALDDAIALDVLIVFGLAIRCRSYPDTLGYADAFGRVDRSWRPELTD